MFILSQIRGALSPELCLTFYKTDSGSMSDSPNNPGWGVTHPKNPIWPMWDGQSCPHPDPLWNCIFPSKLPVDKHKDIKLCLFLPHVRYSEKIAQKSLSCISCHHVTSTARMPSIDVLFQRKDVNSNIWPYILSHKWPPCFSYLLDFL